MRQNFWDDSTDAAFGFHWNREAIQDALKAAAASTHGHPGLPEIGIPPHHTASVFTPVHSDTFSFSAGHSGEDLGDRPAPTIATDKIPFMALQHNNAVFAAGPSQASEIAFLNGIDASGHVVATSFQTWNGDSPATYLPTSTTAKWGAGTAGTPGGTVNFFFKGTYSATEKTVIQSALALWSSVANIQFQEVGSAASAQLTFKHNGGGSAFENDTSLSGPAGAGNVGSATLLTRNAATISIDTSVPGFGPADGSFTAFGGYVWGTIIHEIGHSLDLGHGGAYNGDVNNMTQQYSAYDSLAWTIMSYIEPGDPAKFSSSYPVNTTWGISADGYTNTPTTIMMLDILAVQQLYGAATSTPFSGGQIYGFNTNITGLVQKFYDFTVNTTPIVTLWNSGTNNTLDLSGFATDATIDLNAGKFSSFDGMVHNLAIAMNTAIDKYVGTSGADSVTANADADTLSGGNGDDTFQFNTTFTAADAVDGGAGTDTLVLNGKTSASFTATTLTNVETIDLVAGTKFKLTTNDATVGAGKTLTVDGSTLTSGQTMTFNGAAEKDGAFILKGGAGADVLTGGTGNDNIDGGAGNDTLKGGKGADLLDATLGNDTLIYSNHKDSTGPIFDTAKGFDFNGGDHFDLEIAVSGIDTAIMTGNLSNATFNADLVAAVGNTRLGVHHAVLYTPGTGDYHGVTFLIVDDNGVAGYQSGADYVIRLDSPLNTGSLATGDFV